MEEYCKYDSSKTNDDQPAGIKTCLTSCSSDECKANCEDTCYSKSDSEIEQMLNLENIFKLPGSTSFSEPPWVSIGGENSSLSIEERSQMLITAQGTIDLGGKAPTQTLSINPQDTGNKSINLINSDTNKAKFIGGEDLQLPFHDGFHDPQGTNP